MELNQILLLAVVQGLTEFLPISSSAHLILAPHLFGYVDQGLAFDVSVHVGSLTAVVLYFRREVAAVTVDFFSHLPGRGPLPPNARLGWLIVLATIPVGLFGLLMKSLVEGDLRSPLVIAATTIGFGLVLWYADHGARRERQLDGLHWRDALVIGLFQAVAVIPGVSRSGSTITAGLLLGFTRETAAHFSFLLSIPTILMSGGLVILELIERAEPVHWGELVSGALLSFVAAYTCIHYFLRFIERIGMFPFVLYRLALGVLILSLVGLSAV